MICQIYQYIKKNFISYNNQIQYQVMSKHSKNNTSSTIFTYAQKQKLKNIYGTIQTRIGQDSVKKIQDCTICHSKLIQPTSCDHGHLFCRSCVIEFLVKQKKKIVQQTNEIQKIKSKEQIKSKEEELKNQVEKLQKFQKFDNFISITERKDMFKNDKIGPLTEKIDLKTYIKPTGIYQQNKQKEKYVQNSFWTMQNTPQVSQKANDKIQKYVQCPGTGIQHKLSLKKLRSIKINEFENIYYCWICRKQIGKQKIGCYKCGHLVCQGCKSQKCQVCDQKDKWLNIQGNLSSFASHNNVQVKTYTYAFQS